MRDRYLFATALLGTLAIVGCRDDALTATRSAEPTGAARAAAARHAAGRPAPGSVTVPPVGGFVSTLLARGTFVDQINLMLRLEGDRGTEVVHVNDMDDMVMSRITIQPNNSLPWHTHPGPAFVTVTAGTLTVVDGDTCEARTFGVGTSFIDPGQGHVHVGFNGGSTEMVLYVTYVGVPAGASPLIPTTNPGC
jgi:quercetin dioxygenase-like cupin family protein